MMCLRNMPALGPHFRYNELTGDVEWRGKIVRDVDYVDVRLIVEAEKIPCDKNDVPTAIERVASDHIYNPIKDYLASTEWDERNRINEWMCHALGAPVSHYNMTVGRKFLIGAVARTYQPGCKMDNMLVLEGPQDIGKSTALAALFGRQYFIEATADMRDHPRFVAQMKGKWVLEFAELAAIRRSDLEMVKAIITTQIDRVRLPYRRNATEHPRRCVLAATVNPQDEAGYLTDPTGNRRFWPVLCSRIDIEWIEANRDQLWAEAKVKYDEGEHWWLENGEREEATAEQQQRVSIDPWQDYLSDKLFPEQRYTSVELLNLLNIPIERQGQREKDRIARAMRGLGWIQRREKTRFWIRNTSKNTTP